MPTRFMARTWIFRAQALVFGGLAAFSLVLGPLFVLGLMHDANGRPAADAGIALSAMSLPMLLVFALALYNLRSRRWPILRLCREGIEIVEIGASSLDRIPSLPGLVRVAWLILSTQGFRKRVARVPWRDFGDVWVSGPPMSRRLTIVTSPDSASAEGLPAPSPSVGHVVLPEVTFADPLDQIAEAIMSIAIDPGRRNHLPSWEADDPAA
jgi:hypothetical protein